MAEFSKPQFDAAFDPEQARQQFADVYEAAHGIQDQNDRYGQAGELGDPEFQEIVTAGVAQEQQQLLGELAVRSDDAPYALLQQQSKTVDAVIAGLQAEAAHSQQADLAEALQKIDALAAQAMELSPASADQIRRLTNERKAAAQAQFAPQPNPQLEALQQIRQDIDELYAFAGRPWPVPLAIAGRPLEVVQPEAPEIAAIPKTEQTLEPEAETEAATVEDETDAHIIDTFGTAFTERIQRQNPDAADRLRSIREHHIDAPEASVNIALYLTENVGENVTVEDLVRFVYGEALMMQYEANQMRSRVTSLLGPETQRRRIQAIMQAEGYFLQYGWRSTLNASGGTTSRHRIYRALLISDRAAAVASSVADGEEVISYEPVPGVEREDVATIREQRRQAAEAQATEEQPVAVTPTPLVIPRFRPPRRQERREADTESTQDTDDQPVEGITTAPPAAIFEAPSTQSEVTPQPTKKEKWERDLRQALAAVLDELYDQGLLKDEPLTAYQVSRISLSKKMGTNEAVERMVNAGLLPRTANSNPAATALNAADIVTMYMLNGHPQDLGRNSKTRQKAARAIIEHGTTSFLEKKKRAEQE